MCPVPIIHSSNLTALPAHLLLLTLPCDGVGWLCHPATALCTPSDHTLVALVTQEHTGQAAQSSSNFKAGDSKLSCREALTQRQWVKLFSFPLEVTMSTEGLNIYWIL